MRNTKQMSAFMTAQRPLMVAEIVALNRQVASLPADEASRAIEAHGARLRSRWIVEVGR